MVQAVMPLMGSFAHSPAAHLLLCGPVSHRYRYQYRSAARGLGTPALREGPAGDRGTIRVHIPFPMAELAT